MTKSKILIQLDPDAQASVFDAVVAVDAEVDHLLQYHGVMTEQVRDLVHGAMFTRGPQDLKHTAVFIGGADVAAGEALLEEVTSCFFGPMRVSVLLDANGANTTAAAAVLSASQHVELAGARATVLAGTGPVGQRVARLLAGEGASVRIGSRSRERAEAVCEQIRQRVQDASIAAAQTSDEAETSAALEGSQIVVSAGAFGVQLLSAANRHASADLRVAIDLNAVPPLGMEGIQVTDKAVDYDGVLCYGAIGVGGLKMKIHRAALRQLFEANDKVLDAEQILAIGQTL